MTGISLGMCVCCGKEKKKRDKHLKIQKNKTKTTTSLLNYLKRIHAQIRISLSLKRKELHWIDKGHAKIYRAKPDKTAYINKSKMKTNHCYNV